MIFLPRKLVAIQPNSLILLISVNFIIIKSWQYTASSYQAKFIRLKLLTFWLKVFSILSFILSSFHRVVIPFCGHSILWSFSILWPSCVIFLWPFCGHPVAILWVPSCGHPVAILWSSCVFRDNIRLPNGFHTMAKCTHSKCWKLEAVFTQLAIS